MKSRKNWTIFAFALIGIATALMLKSIRAARHHHKRLDKEALSRWEGEGGPPPPEDHDEVSAAAA
jgi:hypothetical protein